MSKHIRMLNPSKRGNTSMVGDHCYVMPCDCAGPGGCSHKISVPCKIHFING